WDRSGRVVWQKSNIDGVVVSGEVQPDKSVVPWHARRAIPRGGGGISYQKMAPMPSAKFELVSIFPSAPSGLSRYTLQILSRLHRRQANVCPQSQAPK